MATSKVIELIVKAKDQASKTLDDISNNTEKLNNSLKEVRQISTVATTALVAL
jgi:predicted translin family RNA/ssDNA-binding protein